MAVQFCLLLCMGVKVGLSHAGRNRLRVSNNRMLREIFGPKKDKITGMEKTNKQEHDDVYSSPNIIQVSKSRRMRWVEHVVHMIDRGVAHRVLVGRPKGKRPLGIPRYIWENSIKMGLKEVGCGGMGWSELAQDRNRWWVPVNAVTILWVP